MNRPPFKALIFDMDGLVLDSESGYWLAWAQAAQAMGYELDQPFLASLSGLPWLKVVQYLQDYCGKDFDIERFQNLSGEYWLGNVRRKGVPVKKGFFELLNAIHELKLPFCLASNSRREDVLQSLALAGLDGVFPAIVARDEVRHAKPAPDLFLKAAELLDTAICDCLVLEDSPVGIAAAVAAAAPCIYIPSLYPFDAWAAANSLAVLADLGEVIGFMAECGGG